MAPSSHHDTASGGAFSGAMHQGLLRRPRQCQRNRQPAWRRFAAEFWRCDVLVRGGPDVRLHARAPFLPPFGGSKSSDIATRRSLLGSSKSSGGARRRSSLGRPRTLAPTRAWWARTATGLRADRFVCSQRATTTSGDEGAVCGQRLVPAARHLLVAAATTAKAPRRARHHKLRSLRWGARGPRGPGADDRRPPRSFAGGLAERVPRVTIAKDQRSDRGQPARRGREVDQACRDRLTR
jgi:hypothetical protein